MALASSQSPIHHLPYDILIEIFRSFISSSNLAKSTIPARICNRWRQTILSTPELHTTITFALHDTRPSYGAYILLLLKRSWDRPLDVRFTGRLEDENAKPLEEVIKSCSRWRSVTIYTELITYFMIRKSLMQDMLLLTHFIVDIPGDSKRPTLRTTFPPLLAPNLQHLHLTQLDYATFEHTAFPWSSLRELNILVGQPGAEQVFRALLWGKNLTHCSLHRNLGDDVMSPSPSPWDIPPMITHHHLRVLSVQCLDTTSASSAFALFTRLTLPALIDLGLHVHDPIFLPSLAPFFQRSGGGLQKLHLTFTQNTENRGLPTIFVEIPKLKVLVLDEFQKVEIRELLDETLNLLPELEVLEVERTDDRRSLLNMVHMFISKRMMVDVGVEPEGECGELEVATKPRGHLTKFVYRNGYSGNLLLSFMSKNPEWGSAKKLHGWAEVLIQILQDPIIGDVDQSRMKEILTKVQLNNPTGLDFFFSHLPYPLLQISSLVPGSPQLPLPNGDKHGTIPLAKTILECECIPKLNEFIDRFSREPIVAMLSRKGEVRYWRIKEDEQEIWHANLTRDAWSSSPEQFPLPSVFKYVQ
ncbi:hypothetical protein BDN72DRAFT_881849 [Pluteus cervinus]|uniref:Uncharacterized protein n=1 Tax=Pluteus cervinus TaxID=181527 RepID=A0ACD3ADN8_9AGAR|nr:hypothetical protein BDN72DRAFT_881849 [Pluteus cervinus]